MNPNVFRCFTEKKPGFDVEARGIRSDLSGFLNIRFSGLRLFNRYDIEGLAAGHRKAVMETVLSEPMCDHVYEERLPELPDGVRLLCIEPLPGQFDQRASSCEQCIQMLLGGERPLVRSAKILALEGVDEAGFEKLKDYMINPVECCEGRLDKPETLSRDYAAPAAIPVLEGFAGMPEEELDSFIDRYGLAMGRDDLRVLQEYFRGEGRQPTLTELRVVDTYWSDHCRHTTFHTVIDRVEIRDERVQRAYDLYLSVKDEKKPVTLMGIANAAMKHLRAAGRLPMLDDSDENNACTVKVRARAEDGRPEDWLLFFKNETHNHPTEIEPFGGAATCIGGAIRDPLSGRAYVYQAMRITGSGDPRRPLADTLPGKLPQRKLTVTAAEGYSSYGNQVGLATGYVKELYHDGYVAKRMEVGAVVGAAPAGNVRRETPAPGDAVILLGGRTGRDGIGGATGSSKTHDEDSVAQCAAEVQKGNAPEERKLQRLFRKPEVTGLIKRCNDFGAGGVAVAIGELADGLAIELDAVPCKYEGLDGTELAISESQERMAVVVARQDAQAMIALAREENLEATVVASVTAEPRLVMRWRGETIVDLKRSFLDSNGAPHRAAARVPARPAGEDRPESGLSLAERLLLLASDLNFCSQKGLVERFDGSIGAGSVFMPHGGAHALSETQVMAALLPLDGTDTASVMAYGFDPYATERDPFGGSASAVVLSVAKLAAAGVSLDTIHLTLQEYFPRLQEDPDRWGMPLAALLGAFSAQMGLGIAAIGGKDSMSGSYNRLDVPPTLISFAVGVESAGSLISPEFKAAGHPVYLLEAPAALDGTPDYAAQRDAWERYLSLCRGRKVLAGWACERGGAYGGMMKMSLGNGIGFAGDEDDGLLETPAGSILFEAAEELPGLRLLGRTQAARELRLGSTVLPLDSLRAAWESPLEGVFPVAGAAPDGEEVPAFTFDRRGAGAPRARHARPKAVIPVFPGTNCELDTARAVERAGGEAETVLVRNLTPGLLEESLDALEAAIRSSQMLILPGGFSGGDEPDGAGKYIVSFFRNPRLAEAVHELLYARDGLVLGICNGFQALVKLGLLPFGRIGPVDGDSPTLTFNAIGRHQSRYVTTRVSSVLSPWLSQCAPGELHAVPVSHGEGRLAMSGALAARLAEQGQIAFQYVDSDGRPSMDARINPNGSVCAIEGICSPDGRILGKMAHSERRGAHLAKNIYGNKAQPLFEGGVSYFR